jgi:type II secretory pathway predicted ATPase ExeA
MSLTVNYRDYWKLNRWPFGDCVPPQNGLNLPGQIEADARMSVILERVYPLSVLLGPSGVGKTTFLKRFLQPRSVSQRKQTARPIYISIAGMARNDLFEAIVSCTYDKLARNFSIRNERLVRDVFQSHDYQGLSTIVFLDDVHLASDEVALDVLRLLDAHQNLSIVISATEIVSPKFQQLVQNRAQLLIELRPWSLTDVEQFVQRSIASAGGNPLLFSDQAIVRLHELSDGIARRLIQILEITLLAGASNNAEIITPDLVDAAAEEISIPQAEEHWGF